MRGRKEGGSCAEQGLICMKLLNDSVTSVSALESKLLRLGGLGEGQGSLLWSPQLTGRVVHSISIASIQ